MIDQFKLNQGLWLISIEVKFQMEFRTHFEQTWKGQEDQTIIVCARSVKPISFVSLTLQKLNWRGNVAKIELKRDPI